MGKIKRIFKIIVIGLLSLFVISSIGIFIFLKTFDVSRFKPQLIAAAQNALSRSVNFGDIALRISLKNHVKRLEQGICKVLSGVAFLDIISNFEKIADHLNNIAQAIEKSGIGLLNYRERSIDEA